MERWVDKVLSHNFYWPIFGDGDQVLPGSASNISTVNQKLKMEVKFESLIQSERALVSIAAATKLKENVK